MDVGLWVMSGWGGRDEVWMKRKQRRRKKSIKYRVKSIQWLVSSKQRFGDITLLFFQQSHMNVTDDWIKRDRASKQKTVGKKNRHGHVVHNVKDMRSFLFGKHEVARDKNLNTRCGVCIPWAGPISQEMPTKIVCFLFEHPRLMIMKVLRLEGDRWYQSRWSRVEGRLFFGWSPNPEAKLMKFDVWAGCRCCSCWQTGGEPIVFSGWAPCGRAGKVGLRNRLPLLCLLIDEWEAVFYFLSGHPAVALVKLDFGTGCCCCS